MADSNLVQNFKGLPMGELIGGPLHASCAAQVELAEAMIMSMEKIGFDKDGKTRTIDFELERPLMDSNTGKVGVETITVHAPTLGLVPLPALLIDLVTIDFNMEVKNVETNKDSTDTSLDVEAEAKFLWYSASIKGSVSTHREHTRESDKSAKYTVHVEAKQQPPTEGMGKLMQLLSSAVDPLKIEPSTPPA